MSKHDYIWVVIRIFGIYLIVLAITAIPELVTYTIRVYPFGTPTEIVFRQTEGGKGENLIDYKRVAEQMRVQSLSLFFNSLAKITIFTVIGIYFLRSGRLIFRLMYLNEADNQNVP